MYFTQQQFYGFKHDVSQPIQIYVSGIVDLAMRLRGIGVMFSEDDMVDVIIFNLDEGWLSFASSLTATQSTLTTLDIINMLMDEEGHCSKNGHMMSVDSALAARNSQRTYFQCNRLGHIKARCIAKMDANGRTIVHTPESDRATLAVPSAIEHAF
jgi:hypothetical protein